jgi:hypothetical protein
MSPFFSSMLMLIGKCAYRSHLVLVPVQNPVKQVADVRARRSQRRSDFAGWEVHRRDNLVVFLVVVQVNLRDVVEISVEFASRTGHGDFSAVHLDRDAFRNVNLSHSFYESHLAAELK